MNNHPEYISHPSYRGIAFYVVGFKKLWTPDRVTLVDDDGDEFETNSEEFGEWIDDESTYICVMVGDDRKHELAADECEELSDDDFCGSCGQIGCCHGDG